MINLLELVAGTRTDGAVFDGKMPSPTYRPDAVNETDVDRAGLEAALRSTVRGEVRFSDGDRALYSTDASNYRQIPIGVVVPRDVDDVVATVAACRTFGAPMLSRGGGTSLAGQCCNAGVVIDFSKYVNELIEINWDERWARVQPGIILDHLRKKAEERTLTYGPDPATHDHNTLGGMIGNNSCGMHAQMAGKVEENIYQLEILTYDGLRLTVGETSEQELEEIIAAGGRRGEIYRAMRDLRDRYADKIRARFPDIPRRVSGYNLNELLPENGFNVARALVGSESTLVTVLEAKCKLIWSPPCRKLVVLGFDDVYAAGDAVAFVNGHKPIAVEGMDDKLVGDLRTKREEEINIEMLPPGKGWLMVEFGAATSEEAHAQARTLMEAFKGRPHPPSMKIFDDPSEEKQLWAVREAALGAASKIPGKPEYSPGWEDSACPPERMGDYLRDLRKLYDKYGYDGALYGHFGQGCLHCRMSFDLKSAAGIAHWRAFMKEASQLISSYGGSLSGEHGDGQARAEFLPIMYGDEIVAAFREFKAIWDPDNKMNPGKMVDPFRVDQNLRIGAHYSPWEPKTHFSFAKDHGSFAYAANRCVGVGKCRRHEAGTMCPSYQVTHEEKHSTRGRARMLFEMLEGNPVRGGWRDEAVKDALHLCLSCKGCKGECPVNVDMATYKAEFLSHYYAGRLRPIAAYAFGLMYWWARLASLAPPLVNFIAQTPGLRTVMKRAVTMAPQRRVPLFARQTFKAWFAKRTPRNVGAPEVILWPDTWNNHFHPTTAQAAVEVLENAGFHVTVPKASLCCGRPLYDYGMLDLAKTMLLEIIAELRPQIQRGVCVVGLEPSCVSVFRDEMVDLLHGDEDANRLKNQTFMLTEFLATHARNYTPPKLERKAIVHGHCHHKSSLDFASEEKILRQMGLDIDVLESGCCGMAGSFGFESGEHYDVSIAAGERVLLPKVRSAPKEMLIINDGFSCREQISQTTDRQALHTAQILKMALDHGVTGAHGDRPELHYVPDIEVEAKKATLRGLIVIAATAVLAAGSYVVKTRWRKS